MGGHDISRIAGGGVHWQVGKGGVRVFVGLFILALSRMVGFMERKGPVGWWDAERT